MERDKIYRTGLELKEFCTKYKEIYLYGAGLIGRLNLKILRHMSIEPTGFIITSGKTFNIDGVSIFLVDKIKTDLKEYSGVIASFKDANKKLIRGNIGELPGIFILPYQVTYFLAYEVFFFPYLLGKHHFHSLKNHHSWKNILVIRLDVIGDLILTTAFLRELYSNYPDSHITLVVRSSNYFLFKSCPYISELILYECLEKESVSIIHTIAYSNLPFSKIQQHTKFFCDKWLSKRHYDVVFLPGCLLWGRSAVEALFLAFATNADYCIGRVLRFYFDDVQMKLLYDRLEKAMSLISYDVKIKHEVVCMLDMLRRSGGTVYSDKIELWVDEESRKSVFRSFPDFFDRSSKWIAFGLVGSTQQHNWPPENFCQVIEKLCKKKGFSDRFVLIGGEDAKKNAKALLKRLSVFSGKVLDLTGRTDLMQAVSIMGNCNLYVGADTGLMHMAAALGIPIVELSIALPECSEMDDPNPVRMGPWGVEAIVLQPEYGMDDCTRCCYKNYPHCITQIQVNDVIHAIIYFQEKNREIAIES